MNRFKIGGRDVGEGCLPFIIAEMSGNHNQSLERALAIVDAAADAGAHALKLQTYTAETMTLNLAENEFFIDDQASLWKGKSLYSLYEEAHTPWDWHKPIFDRARERGMIPFSTPFDDSAVEFLETLNVDLYKIASFENTDLRLIKRVAATGKPMIISTGMATIGELADMVEAAREGGCKDLVLLKCTSSYPASPKESNLRTIPHLRELFGVQVGLSDHTMGVGAAVASVALGATVIEKHFTLSRAEGGVDSAFSLEPHELKSLVIETERAFEALGTVRYSAEKEESKSRRFRRTLYFVKDLKAGDVIGEDCIRAIRPGFGMPVKQYDLIVGKRVSASVKKGTPVSWKVIG